MNAIKKRSVFAIGLASTILLGSLGTFLTQSVSLTGSVTRSDAPISQAIIEVTCRHELMPTEENPDLGLSDNYGNFILPLRRWKYLACAESPRIEILHPLSGAMRGMIPRLAFIKNSEIVKSFSYDSAEQVLQADSMTKYFAYARDMKIPLNLPEIFNSWEQAQWSERKIMERNAASVFYSEQIKIDDSRAMLSGPISTFAFLLIAVMIIAPCHAISQAPFASACLAVLVVTIVFFALRFMSFRKKIIISLGLFYAGLLLLSFAYIFNGNIRIFG